MLDPDLSSLYRAHKKPIIIVGMMGTGKSHIGRKLSEALGITFFDSDRVVEEKAGCSINEIFERFGEEKFRSAEANTILELLTHQHAVIATGGGVVTNPEILKSICEKGIVIWLKSDIEKIVQRLQKSKTRPLLQKGDPEDVLNDLHEQRKDLYAQAHIHFEATEGNIHKTLSDLTNTLHAYLKADTF